MAFGMSGAKNSASAGGSESINARPIQQNLGLNDDTNRSNFDWNTFGQVGISAGLDTIEGQQQQQQTAPGQVGFQGLGNELQRSDILGLNFKGLKKAPVPLQALFSPAAAINNLLKRREDKFQKEIDGYNSELNSLYAKQQKLDDDYLSNMHDSALKSYGIAEKQNEFMNGFYAAARHLKQSAKKAGEFASRKSEQISSSEKRATEDIRKTRRWGL